MVCRVVADTLRLLAAQQMPARYEQIGQCAGHEQAMGVLLQPAIAHLGKAEHPLDDPDRMFNHGRPCCTDRSLGGEDWTVYQSPVSDPGQPPCHSKPTKTAVITSQSSGTE